MPETASAPAAAPYAPSSISRLLARVDALPGNGWWVFLAFAAGLFAWAHAILWATGRIPVGTFDPVITVGVPYGPVTLAALAHMNHITRRALQAFWPATGWPDAERGAWEYRLVTLPERVVVPALLVGSVLAIGSYLAAPAAATGTEDDRLLFFVAYAPALLAGYSLSIVGLFESVRRLRLIARIHSEAAAIDPFDRVPVHAFSRVTVRFGLVPVVMAYYSLTVNGAFQAGNAFSIAAIVISVLVGILCFILPLWGIHDRLADAKEALLGDAERRLNRLAAEMNRQIDAGNLDAAREINGLLGGVMTTRDRILHLPTWPWPSGLFRGFVSAILLPVAIYVVTQLVSRQLDS